MHCPENCMRFDYNSNTTWSKNKNPNFRLGKYVAFKS